MVRHAPPTAQEEKVWEQIVQNTLIVYRVVRREFDNTKCRSRMVSAARREAWYRATTKGISLDCICMLHEVEREAVRYGIQKFKAEILGIDVDQYNNRTNMKRKFAYRSGARRGKFQGKLLKTVYGISNP